MRPALAENQLFSGIHGISQGDVHRLSVTAKALAQHQSAPGQGAITGTVLDFGALHTQHVAQLHVVPERVGVTGPDFR